MSRSFILPLLSAVLSARAQNIPLYPPVARVDVAYTHSFPQSYLFPPAASATEAVTFNFNINQSPSWLHFSNTTSGTDPILTFSGTPSPSEAHSTWVRIIRTSSAPQATYTRGFRLFVSANPPPEVALPLTTQFLTSNTSEAAVLSSVEPYLLDSTAAIHIPSAWSFSIGVRPDTFQSTAPQLYYSATLDDGQPLPTWLGFNNRTLTFFGDAPTFTLSSPLSQLLPQSFRVNLGCTDFPNTPPSAYDTFVVVASPGENTTTPLMPGLNLTIGTELEYDIKQSLEFSLGKMDNVSPSTFENVTSALSYDVDLTGFSSWLFWNMSSSVLSGTVPLDYFSDSETALIRIPVAFLDANASTPTTLYNTSIPLMIYPFAFSTPYQINATVPSDAKPGDTFSVSLQEWIVSNGTVTVLPSDCPVTALSYNAATVSLQGSLPLSLNSITQQNQCLVTFSVLDSGAAVTSTSSLDLVIPESLFTTNGTEVHNEGHGKGGLPRGTTIALSILAGLLGLLALLAAIYLWILRVSSSSDGDETDAETAKEPDEMDFMDVIRDSYSRQYEKYKSYRGSNDGGSISKKSEDAASKVDEAASPSRLEAGKVAAQVLGRVPSIPKRKEPDFDMVVVNGGASEEVSKKTSPARDMGTRPNDASVTPTPILANLAAIQQPLPGPPLPAPKALSPSPKKKQAGRFKAGHSRNESEATGGSDRPRRMGLMDVFRKDSPSSVRSLTKLTISNPHPHPNPAFRPETSSINSQPMLSPDPYSSSDEYSRMEAQPSDSVRALEGTWSSTRFSAGTFSSSDSISWESEEAWRAQKQAGAQGIDGASARTKPRRSPSKRYSRRSRPSFHEFSPSRSSAASMAERLRTKMARMSAKFEGVDLGTPDSIVPRRRSDFRPKLPRPIGGVYSEDEDGQFVLREEDVFGVVKPLSLKTSKSSKRSIRTGSTLLPSPLPQFSPVLPLAISNKASSPSDSYSSPNSLDPVGRSHPNEQLDFGEYEHWLHAGILDTPQEDEEEDSDDAELDASSSYHRATLVPVGPVSGNVALRQQLLQPVVKGPNTNRVLSAPGSPVSEYSPVKIAPAVVFRNVDEARRSVESSYGDQISPIRSDFESEPMLVSTSNTLIDTPSIVLSASSSTGSLHALGFTDVDLDQREPRAAFPLSPSKQTVRLVKGVNNVELSPDSISSAAKRHLRKPAIVVEDTSRQPPDIPMHVIRPGRPFAFHPLLSVATTSGRSTPMSLSSTSSHRPVYLALQENGERLPSWLHFDPDALEFWGRPEESFKGHLVIVVLRYSPDAETVRANGWRTPPMNMDEGDVIGRLIVAVS